MRVFSEGVQLPQVPTSASRRAAEAIVDAALICHEELGAGGLSWQARQALIEAIDHNPLLIAQLFSPQTFRS